MKELDNISLQNCLDNEEKDIEEGSYLLNFVRESGLRIFLNSHETDENGMILVDENGDVIREGN